MVSLPVTVPAENETDADSRGRFGSGGAYDDGHARAAGGAGEVTVAAADAVPATDAGDALAGEALDGDALAGAALEGCGEFASGCGLDCPLQAAHSAPTTAATTSRGLPTPPTVTSARA
jgi:hypothetical protein